SSRSGPVRPLRAGSARACRAVGNFRVFSYFDGENVQELLEIARRLTESENAVVFLTTRAEKANFVLATNRTLGLDCGEILRKLSAPGLTGGGKGTIAQGTLPRSKAPEVFAEIARLLGERR
ncbi:MAG: DHHA1 domain-containing protein, partial [Thermoplasmata archaeon]